MDKIILYVIQNETLKSAVNIMVTILTLVIFYFIFLRKPLKSAIKSITTLNTILEANNEITKTMAFMQLQESYYRKKENGGKSVNEDERWNKLWRLYVDLGDGEGDSLKKEWDKIPIV